METLERSGHWPQGDGLLPEAAYPARPGAPQRPGYGAQPAYGYGAVAGHGGTPPGWHPDPWRLAALRWWDGTAWTGHTSAPTAAPQPTWAGHPSAPMVAPQPVPRKRREPLEKLALPALIAGIVGLFPVAIVLGAVSHRRIRRARLRPAGDGLAIAGIVLGITWLVIGALVAAAALGGSGGSTSREQPAFSSTSTAPAGAAAPEASPKVTGEVKRALATFDLAYARGETNEICEGLFTAELSAMYRTNYGSCKVVWDHGRRLHLRVNSVRAGATSSYASATAVDKTGTKYTFALHLGRRLVHRQHHARAAARAPLTSAPVPISRSRPPATRVSPSP